MRIHLCSFCVSVLVAMELKQTRNMLTGKSTLLSTAATSTPEELKHHTGLKIFENDGDCVYVSHKVRLYNLVMH